MSRSRALFANASKISMKKVSTNFQMSLSAKKKLAMADLQGCELWINFWPEASKELWELVCCYVTVRLVRAVTKFIIGIRDFTWRALLKSRPLSSWASMLLSLAPLMLEAVTWIYVQNNLRAVLCSFFDKHRNSTLLTDYSYRSFECRNIKSVLLSFYDHELFELWSEECLW